MEANQGSDQPSISADGRSVAFHSFATNFVPGDTNFTWDAFARDRGPAVGVGDLAEVVDGDRVAVSGWATFSGQVVASGEDAPDDGAPGAREAGAELTGARMVYRHEQEDLLVRLRLASLPGAAVRACSVTCVEASSGAGGPAVLYGLEFAVGEARYEVRAVRPGATAVPPSASHFALYRCEAVCVEQARLSGGIGTTGDDVRVAVPLAAIGAGEGATLTGMRAFVAIGEATSGALVVLDDVALPDDSIPVRRVELGIAPASTPEEEVAIDAEADLVEGRFSATVDVSSLPAGEYLVWARACLGEVCGAPAAEVSR